MMDYQRMYKLWQYKTFSTKTIIFIIGGVAIFIGLILILTFTILIVQANNTAPHEWNITREMWQALDVENLRISDEFQPLRLVIIHHSQSAECHSYRRCVRAMRNLQDHYLNHLSTGLSYDVAFNFLVGNDGRVYEGRGFGYIGAHTLGYNSCSLGIAFEFPQKPNDPNDRLQAPHEWYITREMWRPRWTNSSEMTEAFKPVHLVIILHTVSDECHTFVDCVIAIQGLQAYFLNVLDFGDIGYNFMVGNDGRVYEGRGFGIAGAHTSGYNSCSLGIAFVGRYHEESVVTPHQVKNVHRLLEEAIRQGYLDPDYRVVGARDVRNTTSPGQNLYDEIKTWPMFDHNAMFLSRNCTQIQDMFQNTNTE